MVTKFHEEKLCRVSPNVDTNFFVPTPQMTSRIKLVASCARAYVS